MSNVYNLEPPVSGKVILKTTYGDIEISLFAKETPKACRNFVQLCMEGYYDGCIFHRVIKDFIIQTGDPTGTGEGGDSIYGGLFKDEFHSRLRFAHRGLVACASKDNQKDSNNSQFFITLDKAEYLDRKHTIFGKIEGDTLYNVLKIGDVDVDEGDRPLDPPRIVTTEVLWNPFEDIAPRTTREERERRERERKEAEEKALRQARKGKINSALLSFQGDEEEEEGGAPLVKFKAKNAYDVLVGGPVPEDQLRLQQAVEAEKGRPRETGGEAAAPKSQKDLMKDRIREAMGKVGAPKAPREGREGRAEAPPEAAKRTRDEEGEGRLEYWEGSSEEDEERPAKRHAGEEEGEGEGEGDKYVRGSRPKFERSVKDSDLLTRSQMLQKQYRSRKQTGGQREKDTLAKLSKFTSRLSSLGQGAAKAEGPVAKREGGEARRAQDPGYNGEVDTERDLIYQPAAWRIDSYLDAPDDDEERVQGGIAALRKHKLQFLKDPAKKGPDDLSDYVVVDPLLQEGKDKFNKQQQRDKKRGLEWAGGSRN